MLQNVTQKFLISGTSGFIGGALVSFLRGLGHSVVRLVRPSHPKQEDTVIWDPSTGSALLSDLEGFDVFIHLAGENVGEGWWTRKKKQRIFQSRCRDSWTLGQLLKRLHAPPQTVIAVSAIGYYGDRGDELLDESSHAGKGFLAEVCVGWERAFSSLEEVGVRVLHPRLGLVLSEQRGALKKMAWAFRHGLGAYLGSGMQWVSWVALEDVLHAIVHMVSHVQIRGALNVTSPDPVRQKDFACLLAESGGSKVHLRAPSCLIELLSGEKGKELLLASQRVAPTQLLQTGYSFVYKTLREYFF